MSISPAQKSSSAPTREPLKSLLDTIRRARTLDEVEVEVESASSDGGDPLAGLRQIIEAEAAHQAQTAPLQWYGPDSMVRPDVDGPDAGVPAPAGSPNRGQPAGKPAGKPTSGQGGASASVEARVGREVLAMLAEQPLNGAARAAAVERLAAQLDDPDPRALREVLALLVTGQAS